MNITHPNSINSCTSCQVCGAICPTQAISIELDEEGFYRPSVNNDKCTDCGLCVKTCYKFDDNIHISSNEDLQKTPLYAAAAINDDVVKQTTSGGIADLLAKKLINEGYKVVGVVYDYTEDRAVHQIASSIEETTSFRGSKYIQPYSMKAFREAIKDCRNQNYAIFGLPCQIYAISKILEKKKLRKQCLLVDLFCHGCPSMLVWEKTAEMIKQKMKCKTLKEVNFRSKRRGWGTFVLEAKSVEKRYQSKPLENGFFDLFFSNQVLNESCTNCKLRRTLSYTDIRLGDFWGKKYRKNIRGVSGVTISSTEGQLIFEKIQPKMSFTRESFAVFLPYQSWDQIYPINEKIRIQLISLLKDKEKDINAISNYLFQQKTIKTKGKIYIKQLLSYLPIKFTSHFRQ